MTEAYTDVQIRKHIILFGRCVCVCVCVCGGGGGGGGGLTVPSCPSTTMLLVTAAKVALLFLFILVTAIHLPIICSWVSVLAYFLCLVAMHWGVTINARRQWNAIIAMIKRWMSFEPLHELPQICPLSWSQVFVVRCLTILLHDDVIKWKHFPRNWPFVRGIHRSRWIPHTKASDVELWGFLWSASEYTVE